MAVVPAAEPFSTEGGIEFFDPCDEHGYLARRVLPDGRVLGVTQMLYTAKLVWTTHIGAEGYEDGWCYRNALMAVAAMGIWDGTGEPEGWHRHPPSGRRRDGGDPARERVDP